MVQFVRDLDLGMGKAVARRTVFRPEDEEKWESVARRVSAGNCSLHPSGERDVAAMESVIAKGALLMSGRHLQHGDESQPSRAIEVMTNCSSAAASFAKFYLLLNGSGVGRSYDDVMMAVDWQKAPKIRTGLSSDHKDYPKDDAQLEAMAQEWFQEWIWAGAMTLNEAILAYSVLLLEWVSTHSRLEEFEEDPENYVVLRVPDSREGWADAVELIEWMAFKQDKRTLVLDWTLVRPKGTPIHGMQDRPASGPQSPMRGIFNIMTRVINAPAPMPRWKQAMIVDHYLSVEVQVGGARRAARMATKDWRDPDIMEFVYIKSKGGLWTSNNSVMVDAEFWELLRKCDPYVVALANAIMESSYINGEPGLINGDKLKAKGDRAIHLDGSDFRSDRYTNKVSTDLLAELGHRAARCRFPYITNPCGEIVLHILGAYCVIADVAPLLAFWGDLAEAISLRATLTVRGASAEEQDAMFAAWDAEFLLAAEIATRALMRTNLMPALYQKEVQRTNRIGVGLTGLHEYAWLRFGATFDDLIDENNPNAKRFWAMLEKVSRHVQETAKAYAAEMGVEVPHTALTMKPAGTTSKLYGLTEGAHLPEVEAAIRWVQFRADDPLVSSYEAKGYPKKVLKTFAGMVAIGFPKIPLITRIGMPYVTTAAAASPDQHYKFIELLEKHWLGSEMDNQVSYTMKIRTDKYTLDEFRSIVQTYQPRVKCCTILPQRPAHEMGYEYLPEEEAPLSQVISLLESIDDPEMVQALDLDALRCAAGACPI